MTNRIHDRRARGRRLWYLPGMDSRMQEGAIGGLVLSNHLATAELLRQLRPIVAEILATVDARACKAQVERSLEDPRVLVVKWPQFPPQLLDQELARLASPGPAQQGKRGTMPVEMVRLVRASLQAAQRLEPSANAEDVREVLAEIESAESPYAYATREELAPDLMELLTDHFMGLIATMALIVIEEDDRPAPDAVRDYLAQTAVKGMRQQLRIIASTPGADVPTDLIPLADRLNIDALHADWERRLDSWDKVAGAYRRSGSQRPWFPFSKSPHA